MQSFYDKHRQDIELIIFLHETGKNGKLDVAGNKESEYAWFAVENVVVDLMGRINIK